MQILLVRLDQNWNPFSIINVLAMGLTHEIRKYLSTQSVSGSTC